MMRAFPKKIGRSFEDFFSSLATCTAFVTVTVSLGRQLTGESFFYYLVITLVTSLLIVTLLHLHLHSIFPRKKRKETYDGTTSLFHLPNEEREIGFGEGKQLRKYYSNTKFSCKTSWCQTTFSTPTGVDRWRRKTVSSVRKRRASSSCSMFHASQTKAIIEEEDSDLAPVPVMTTVPNVMRTRKKTWHFLSMKK